MRLHKQHIVHRDIKPENIFLTGSQRFKLGDFGLAIQSSLELPYTRSGTLDYLSPEVERDQCLCILLDSSENSLPARAPLLLCSPPPVCHPPLTEAAQKASDTCFHGDMKQASCIKIVANWERRFSPTVLRLDVNDE